MKKYKLIKEYPGSPVLGTEVEECASLYMRNFSLDFDIHRINVINFPEFWEEIKEKEYEILTISSNDKNNTYDVGTVITFLDTEEPFDEGWQKYWNIHSVKRLSDGEIFTIGDTIRIKKLNNDGRFEISKFYFDCNNEHLLCNREKCGNGHVNITKIEHVKQPLFITEDGKEIFEGDKYSYVNYLLSGFYNIVAHKGHEIKIGMKAFSTETLAKNYIEKMRYLVLFRKDLQENCKSMDINRITLKDFKYQSLSSGVKINDFIEGAFTVTFVDNNNDYKILKSRY